MVTLHGIVENTDTIKVVMKVDNQSKSIKIYLDIWTIPKLMLINQIHDIEQWSKLNLPIWY